MYSVDDRPFHSKGPPPPIPPRPPPPPTQVAFTHTQPAYKQSAKRRTIKWALVAGVILVIALIVALCTALITRRKASSSGVGTSDTGGSDENGGHPLSIDEGGVVIGKPGDIATFGNRSTDHFVLTTNRSSFVTRLDPIVSPGNLSEHVHRVHGSNYFSPNLVTATQQQTLGTCSTTPVQDDKSLYWVPQMYYRHDNGSLSAVPIITHSVYYFLKAPTGQEIYPFPDNYNVLVGDPNRRAVNTSDPNHSALWYNCYRGGGNDLRTDGFPPTQCSDGLIMTIQYPSCWDGITPEDGKYTSHVAYPKDNTNGFHCPEAFPKKLITIQFETLYAVQTFPFNGENQTWALANGDTTGLGIHGDFANGWKAETLQRIVTDCRYMNATDEAPQPEDPANCPWLNNTINLPKTYACRSTSPIINESVGALSPLENLPGCNALWSGNTKPACPPGSVVGGFPQLVEPTVWLHDEGYVA